MSAVAEGIQPWVFKPTAEQGWRAVQAKGELGDWFPMKFDPGNGYIVASERIVPPVVPDFDEPCPDCVAPHKQMAKPKAHWTLCDCPTCNGTGTVQRVWRAERLPCWEWNDKCPTDDPCPAGVQWLCPTRLAVVSWYPVTVLPVVQEDSVGDPRHLSWQEHVAVDDHGAYIYSEKDDGWGWLHRPCAEPWATDLEPGCVVAIPGDEVRLDEPITEMVCPSYLWRVERGVDPDDGIGPECGGVCPTCQDTPGVVPLLLTEGLNDIELAAMSIKTNDRQRS